MCVSTQHYWRDDALPFVELRSTYDSLQAYKPHFHAELSFGAVIAGETRASCGGRDRVLQEGDLVLVAPHIVHSCNPIAERPRSYHMLYLDEAWCRASVPTFEARWVVGRESEVVVIRDAQLFRDYREFVMSLANLPASEAAEQLRQLLTRAAESMPAATLPSRSRDLPALIKQALLASIESPPTLDQLAERFGCCRETVIRVFQRAYQITPHAFANNARIEQAKQRLKAGEAIARVAADLGFSDQAQLHRTFVSYTASTPGQYRRARSAADVNFRQ